jgi:hypothetical protein
MRPGIVFRDFILWIGIAILALSVLVLSFEARTVFHPSPQSLVKTCKVTPDALELRLLTSPPPQLAASPVLVSLTDCGSAVSPAEPLYVNPVRAFRAGLLRAPPSRLL